MSLSTDELARRFGRLERSLAARSAGPQLAFSSIEDGAVHEYDIDGQLSSTIGKQYDGTHGAVTLAGPPPPIPAGPLATPVPAGALVRWQGDWEPLTSPDPNFAPTPVVAPLDFARVEVHSGSAPTRDALFASLRGAVESPRGGDLQIPIEGPEPIFVWLIARSTAGKVSAASIAVGPIFPGKLPTDAVDVDWDALSGNTTFPPSIDAPIASRVGDLWPQLPDNIIHQWDGDSWNELRDQGVAAALVAAAQAAQDAADAMTSANGKVRYITSATKPAYSGDADTAVWIDTANGRRLSRWNGTDFETQQWGNLALQPGSIVGSDVLVSGSVMAAQLHADSINGKTITGATIQTAASGARVVHDLNGIRAFNVTGTAVTTISNADGSITTTKGTITGALIRTAASGQRVELDSTNGLRGINSAGTAMTSISPSTGALTATSALITGEIATAPSGARLRARQASGLGELSFYSGAATEVYPATVQVESTGATHLSHGTFTVDGVQTGGPGVDLTMSGSTRKIQLGADVINLGGGYAGRVNAPGVVRCLSEGDAGLTSTGHAFQVGAEKLDITFAPSQSQLLLDRDTLVTRVWNGDANNGDGAWERGGLTYVGAAIKSEYPAEVLYAAGGTYRGNYLAAGVFGFDFAAPTFRTPTVYRGPDGFVTLTGLLGCDSAPQVGGVLGTLPVKYRPSKIEVFVCPAGGNNQLWRCDIYPSGQIRFGPPLSPSWVFTPGSVGSASNLSLGGVRYPAADAGIY